MLAQLSERRRKRLNRHKKCVCMCVCVRLSSPFRSGVWLQPGDALRERAEHRPSLRQALYWGRGEERYSQTHSRPPADVIPCLLQTREGSGSALWHKSSNKNVPWNVCDWSTERAKKKRQKTHRAEVVTAARQKRSKWEKIELFRNCLETMPLINISYARRRLCFDHKSF